MRSLSQTFSFSAAPTRTYGRKMGKSNVASAASNVGLSVLLTTGVLNFSRQSGSWATTYLHRRTDSAHHARGRAGKTDMMYARVTCPSTVFRHKVLTADYLHPQDDDGCFHHTATTASGRKARDLERSSSDRVQVVPSPSAGRRCVSRRRGGCDEYVRQGAAAAKVRVSSGAGC